MSKTPFTANCAAVKAATCAFEFGAAGMISGPSSCVIPCAKCEGAGLRSRAVPAEHRVSRQEARAVDTAEYSRIPLPSRATSRQPLGYLSAISGLSPAISRLSLSSLSLSALSRLSLGSLSIEGLCSI